MSALAIYYYSRNHNYNKILKSDWLSTVLISALTGQFDKTVRAITRALKWLFFNASKKLGISCISIQKRAFFFTNFVKFMINWLQNLVSSNSGSNHTRD